MSERSDSALLQAFLAGDLEAYDDIVDRFSASVYRLALKFTRSQADAEDIAQETFLSAYENLLKAPKDLPLKPWLMTICVNLCRNLARKKKSFNFSDLEKSDEEGESDIAGKIRDEDLNPLEKAKQNENVGHVQSALQKIPEKYRIILELRYMEDLSYQEIAEILNLPLNTVKVQLNRAKTHIQTELK